MQSAYFNSTDEERPEILGSLASTSFHRMPIHENHGLAFYEGRESCDSLPSANDIYQCFITWNKIQFLSYSGEST